MHVHYLPHLSLSYSRHTNTVNETFILLSEDYSKSLHLQTDRFLEFHTPGGLHYTTRIPRYGRDLVYDKRNAEALVPSVGVSEDGNGEVFRLNLELGRFMKGYQVDVGGDDLDSMGGGALQGGIRAGSVNCAAVAEQSHGLLAFGTSLGTVEFWDSRSRNRVSALGPPSSLLDFSDDERPAITALDFHPSGLQLATGASNGIIHTYDMRSPVPLLKKDQGYSYPIKQLQYLTPNSRTAGSLSSEKIMSADKRVIKIWDAESGDPWTAVEPAVDLNHVEWCRDSGMLLTANEGRQQHSFFIPQLGPAPKWCSFLDNLVEEMAEDSADPSAYSGAVNGGAGEVYDNYKFVDQKQLRDLNLDHLVGTTSLLRPYMHGFFVAQKLYEQARLISNPEVFEQQRTKSIQAKIDKERESRIRGNKKVAVKVNRRLAEKMALREEANEKRKAQRVLRQGGDEPQAPEEPEEPAAEAEAEEVEQKPAKGLMGDNRFRRLFEDEEFEIDETSREFAMHNPSTAVDAPSIKKRGLTAVEQEVLDDRPASSDDEDDEDSDEVAETQALEARQRSRKANAIGNGGGGANDNKRIGSSSYKKSGHQPRMQVSSSNPNANKKAQLQRQNKSFGELAERVPAGGRKREGGRGDVRAGGVVGEKEVTFAPAAKGGKKGGRFGGAGQEEAGGRDTPRGKGGRDGKDRRSASGNVFRRM